MKLDLNEVKVIELTREHAREIEIEGVDDDTADEIMQAINEVQADADEEGRTAYLVLKIAGSPL